MPWVVATVRGCAHDVAADADLTRVPTSQWITLEAKRIKANDGLQADGAWSVNHWHPRQIRVGSNKQSRFAFCNPKGWTRMKLILEHFASPDDLATIFPPLPACATKSCVRGTHRNDLAQLADRSQRGVWWRLVAPVDLEKRQSGPGMTAMIHRPVN